MARKAKTSAASKTTSKKTKAPWDRQRVQNWNEFQQHIADFLDGNYLFRGVSSVRFPLVTSVGRQRGSYQ